ncbi:hypothetical protein [Paenibacillus sanfengchensis]|uniref:hypothetical protein n=1 Tax=Paenibacillus sanfengchensis TaxID=3119819 RepID=UPI002FE034CD
MLTFEQKLQILDSYPELERKNVSLGRVNYQYEQSVYDKKTVAYHLHPNGNGYVYAGLLEGYETDDKGYVNIREFTEQELRDLLERSIRSLSVRDDRETDELEDPLPSDSFKDTPGGLWRNADGAVLTLKYEDDLWYIFAGQSLEMVFETREEAGEYLAEEGFVPQKK